MCCDELETVGHIKCLVCKQDTVDDYFTIDCKRILRRHLYSVPTYVLCPDCYKSILETLKEKEHENGCKNY